MGLIKRHRPDTIEVTIGRIVQRPVTQRELDPSYIWIPSPNQINVRLLGPPERLQVLNPSQVRAVVDLAEFGPGFYKVKPLISLPDRIEVDSISPEVVDITIQLIAPPTATPIITSTEIISVTLTPPITLTQIPQIEKDE